MIELPVSLDTTKLESGARRGTQALDRFGSSAVKATTSVTTLQGKQEKAFGVTGGALAISGGIQGVTSSLNSMNLAMATMSVGRVLMDFSRMKMEFGEFSNVTAQTTRNVYGQVTAVRKATGIWSTLGAVIKAHPMLTFVTAISAAAGAMALFGGSVDETAKKFEDLGKAMAKISAEERVGAAFGRKNVRDAADKKRIESLFQAAVEVTTMQEDVVKPWMKVSDLRELLGPNMGAEKLLTPEQIQAAFAPEEGFNWFPVKTLHDRISTDQAISFLAKQAQGIQSDIDSRTGPTVTVTAQRMPNPAARHAAKLAGKQIGQDNLFKEIVSEEALERMRELNMAAREFGVTIGHAMTDLIFGLTDAKTALRNIGMDLVRQFITKSTSDMFGGFFPTEPATAPTGDAGSLQGGE